MVVDTCCHSVCDFRSICLVDQLIFPGLAWRKCEKILPMFVTHSFFILSSTLNLERHEYINSFQIENSCTHAQQRCLAQRVPINKRRKLWGNFLQIIKGLWLSHWYHMNTTYKIKMNAHAQDCDFFKISSAL